MLVGCTTDGRVASCWLLIAGIGAGIEAGGEGESVGLTSSIFMRSSDCASGSVNPMTDARVLKIKFTSKLAPGMCVASVVAKVAIAEPRALALLPAIV